MESGAKPALERDQTLPAADSKPSVPAAKSDWGEVRSSKLYNQVARKLETFILEELKPGDKLPPERELTKMFRVSRSSVRDAIRRLELMGLVEPRQGSGTTVRELSTDALVSPLASILMRQRKHVVELLEVRKIIEPAVAARAAAHVNREQLAGMEEILERQAARLKAGETAIEEDSQFHYAVARAADNSVLLHVLDILMDLLRETRERALQVEGRPKESFAGHKQLLAALKRKDARAAEAAMRDHLEHISKLILKT